MLDWWDNLTWFSKLLIFLALTICLSTIVFLGGVFTDNKELIVIGGVIRSLTTFAVVGVIALIITGIGIATGNSKSGAQISGALIGSLVIPQLMTTQLAAIIPFRNMPQMISVFLIGVLTLAAIGFWKKFPQVTLGLTLLIVGISVFAFYFPGRFQLMSSRKDRDDQSKLIPQRIPTPSPSNLRSGGFDLFGSRGESLYWFGLDDRGLFKLYVVVDENHATDPDNGLPLQPLRSANREALIASAEREHRLKQKNQETPASSKQAALFPSPPATNKLRIVPSPVPETLPAKEPAPAAAVPAKPAANPELVRRLIAAPAFRNLEHSAEVVVLFSDTNFRLIDDASRKLAGQLLFANLNANGSFFSSAAVPEIMTKLFRGDRSLIRELGLAERTDYLVLGIVSSERLGGRSYRDQTYRAKVIVRLIPTREDAAKFEELKFEIQEERPEEALGKALRLLVKPLTEKIRSVPV